MTICLHDFVTGALQQNHYCCHACALVQDSELPFVQGTTTSCLDEFVAGILQKNHLLVFCKRITAVAMLNQ